MTDLQLFDAATSLGVHPAHANGPGTAQFMLEQMDRYKIAEAVVGHTLASHHEPHSGNAQVLADTAQTPRLFPAWTILPPRWGELEQDVVTQASGAGIVLFSARPLSHGYDLAGTDMRPVLTAAADAGVPLLLELAECGWSEIERISQLYPCLRVIVTDIGYRELRTLCGVLERNSSIFVTTANLSGHLALEFIAENFGADRLLFGTGGLVRDPGEAVLRLLWSDLDDAQAQMIGGDNLRGLLTADSKGATDGC